jgi:DivIVA domain-containing protein
MSEERLVSISSSSHLTPDDVARHSFGTVRRGFDPGEVRAYLESLAAGLRGVAERERELLEQLGAAEDRARHPVFDDSMLTSALGNETARVLQSAHEVAAEMVAKAEAEAARLLTEASAEIEQNRTRTEARLAELSAAAEAAALELSEATRQEANATMATARNEADALLDQARDECRGMVDEAQALRTRVLGDLSKRRKVLHAQIEQLRAGRERLAQTVLDARRSVDAIAGELFNAEDNARLAAESAGREALERADYDATPEELAAQLLADGHETADEAGLRPLDTGGASGTEPIDVGVADDVGDEDTEGSDADPADAPVVAEVDELFAKIRAARLEEAPGDVPAPDVDRDPADTAAVVPSATSGATAKANPKAAAKANPKAAAKTTPKAAASPVDPVVSEAPPEDDGGDDGGGDGPPDEQHPLAVRRDELIEPIVTTLARRLKRTLQDTQNDLLDSLRSNGSRWSTGLLPDETEHLDTYSTAALPALEQAAAAGVSFAASPGATGPKTDVLVGVAHELAEAVVGPLRRRLAGGEGLDDAEESVVGEHVGAAFREWKGERIERLAADHVVAAFSTGTLAAAEGTDGAQLEWVAVSGSEDPPCPDCEDNGLSGSQAPGEEFPTGHRHPPAHPGCRCLLAPSAT